MSARAGGDSASASDRTGQGQFDDNMEFSATRGRDVYYIQTGDERYEIAETFIFGG